MNLQKDLRGFIELLNSQSVDFLVVVGHAVAFHGYPRFTGDIDFFIRPTQTNAECMMKVIESFGFSSMGLDVADFVHPNQVIQLGRPPNRIDILTSISGVEFQDAWDNRVYGDLDGLSVPFLGLGALLKNKQASGRPKDLADIAKLRAIARQQS